MKGGAKATRKGRPRAFDADRALDQAMRVFWRHGYEGASLPSLTKAMGINRPSLYAAFGNKEALFRKALDRYVAKSCTSLSEALAQPTARAVVEHLLRGAVAKESPDQIRGCMLVQGALACSDGADPIRVELADRRAAVERLVRQRFERARAEGDLPPDADPAALAKFIATIQQGMAVQIAGGASCEELRAVVELALQAWPS